MTKFADLVGQTLTIVEGAEKGSEEIFFSTADGKRYKMYHDQDCCEHVLVEDVAELGTILNTPVLKAEETTGTSFDADYDGRCRWTFYTICTRKGMMHIRWLGESNGYYSEGVDFEEVTPFEEVIP